MDAPSLHACKAREQANAKARAGESAGEHDCVNFATGKVGWHKLDGGPFVGLLPKTLNPGTQEMNNLGFLTWMANFSACYRTGSKSSCRGHSSYIA